jgi:UDP-GlcNAc3NAcA epimerase
MLKIVTIIGARPQFIKHAVLEPELKKHFKHISIHSGQHYDEEMSKVFFNELGIDQPTYMLKAANGLHGKQTAQILIETEKILLDEKPDMLIVYGDTNTTLAGALAASKLNIPIAHIEAGMRSFNREMPEETNRVLTDHMSDLLFTSSEESLSQLKREGITKGVFNCGDIMKDLTYLIKEKGLVNKDDTKSGKIYCTLHRPYNTDKPKRLKSILDHLNRLNKKVVFAIHPRTQKMMAKYHFLEENSSNIEFIKPQSYIKNLNNLFNFDAIITDSGGMQKEAYFLQKRCITLRSETEWVETLDNNWNTLVFENLNELESSLNKPLGAWNESLYGDGEAGRLIVNQIIKYFDAKLKVKS